ncbi:MAG TPA: RHS repeat domain-containing protein, partial [Chloroflexota bacterium]|nr:RHS repeat domain-containing protein [Chloroflexota bacterium]
MRRVLAVWLLAVALLYAVVPLGARTSAAAMTQPTWWGGYDTVPIAPTTLAANTTYWLAFNGSASDTKHSFDADEYGSFVGSTAVSFGTWPSSFPSVTRSGTPAYMLYALEGGASSPPPTGTVTAHLAYRYDAAGRRTGLTLPDGKTQSWSYDAAG